MNNSIYEIPFTNLVLIFPLVAVVSIIYIRWSLDVKTVFYGTLRMVVQLTFIGFALTYLFHTKSPYLICLILCIMLIFASWIALRPLKDLRRKHFTRAFAAIFVGSLSTLPLVIFGVVRIDPWYEPRYLVPLAGMIFANSMNTVSLAADRFEAETRRGETYVRARSAAYQTSLIPMLNAFFAVGLVSLPGMMTGQIIAGISPLIAIRYQIMVMCMLLGCSGIASAVYLQSLKSATRSEDKRVSSLINS